MKKTLVIFHISKHGKLCVCCAISNEYYCHVQFSIVSLGLVGSVGMSTLHRNRQFHLRYFSYCETLL